MSSTHNTTLHYTHTHTDIKKKGKRPKRMITKTVFLVSDCIFEMERKGCTHFLFGFYAEYSCAWEV